uniref:Cell death inducing DFFA like effector a n=1 Tax=Sinocyclocheilus grahami TaxID=75366 RepID=A0A672LAH7_SINGR
LVSSDGVLMWCCRSVSSVQTSLAQRMLPPPQPRPYKVCTQNRRRRKGFTASSLADLVEQVRSLDGSQPWSWRHPNTARFACLLNQTHLMQVISSLVETSRPEIGVLPSFRQPRRSGIAKLSFDLYRLNPKDFLGCLTVKATLYEIYTLSYDIKCTRAKYFLKSLLRCFMYMAKLAGQVLLCGSAYLVTDQDSGKKLILHSCLVFAYMLRQISIYFCPW